MSDLMRPIPFAKLIDWVITEYRQNKSVFGIPAEKFYQKDSDKDIKLFGEPLDTPVGPAAGPHTQLAQNIVTAYLSGGRFFELKTVQILDELEFAKPCIKAEDECYNTEWSTELAIRAAFAEYIKAWFVLHILEKEIFHSNERRFVFNMSVGYDLDGIRSAKVDSFIEGLKDASQTEEFLAYKKCLMEKASEFEYVDQAFIDSISGKVCNSITLSTLHGCPPAEIEAIAKYLIRDKHLHTFVKMNPTLLGYEYVHSVFRQMGYTYIELKQESFTHDLQYADGIAMLHRLKTFAKEHHKEFGVKLSNTLPVRVTQQELPGDEMYMSGRALYPLTVNLAYKLAAEFGGDLRISYSGGADVDNIVKLFATGIRPITLATTLLKPGGYARLQQIAAKLEPALDNAECDRINLAELKLLAESALTDPNHLKAKKPVASRKILRQLSLTDCFVAPCTVGCPIEQDIPEYIRLVGEGKYTEALEVITAKNPLPFITGTICNHQCMTKCTRLDYDESVRIRDMKLTAAQKGYANYMSLPSSRVQPAPGAAKVAVIGAGPSGLAAGYFLAKAGLDVTIFDRRARAGGTVANIIPGFRIFDEAIANDLELVKGAGVKFALGVQKDLTLQELRERGFAYIYLAIGAGKTTPLQLEGDSPKVLGAINFLEQFKKNPGAIKLGKQVAVIGGGNSAMDAARAALLVAGVEKVSIIYRRTRAYMPADQEELQLAMQEGVGFYELLSPQSFEGGVLKCQKMELGPADAAGRRQPVAKPGEYEFIPVDTVLAAIGERVDHAWLRENGVAVDDRGNLNVNPETLETNLAGVYIGGDALAGPSTVVQAIAHGTKAAKAILAKENLTGSIGREFAWNAAQLQQISAKKGILQHTCGNEQEPARCLECNYVCNICTEVCPNRANVAIRVNNQALRNLNQVVHIDGMCNECGNCAVFCPNDGAPYQAKLTLFWNETDFANSTNPGFLLEEGGAEPVFKVRLAKDISSVRFNANGDTSGILDEAVAAIIWTTFKEHSYLF